MDKPVLLISSPYDEGIIKSIRDGFTKKLGKAPDFEVVENDNILGGFIAIIDGKVYDASYSSRLYEISRQLSE